VIFTTLLASAVPERINVLSLVMPSLLLRPVSSVIAAITGAAGAVTSTTTWKVAETALEFPAASIDWAVKLWVPPGNEIPE
jgi:hypothetical protein